MTLRSRPRSRRLLIVAAALAVIGCGSGDSDGDSDASPAADAAAPDATDLACERTPAAADRDRFVVISRPFAEGGGPSTLFEVWQLSAAGELSATGETFDLSRAFDGTIAFTADGEIGVVAHDDGSVGVFRIDSAGSVTVLETALRFDYYVSEVRASADGRRILVIDGEFRNIGGGIYSLAVACDGSLIDEGLVAPAQLPADIAHVGNGRAIIPADDILDSPVGESADVHLVDLSGGSPRWISGTSVFGLGDAIVSEVAVSASGSLVVMGDNCGFCGPNRIGVAKLSGDSLVAAQTMPFNDPYDLIASPFDDRILAVSGFGNAAFELVPSTSGTEPYDAPLELVYTGGAPQLPGQGVMIERGSLEGMVLLPETIGVRRIQFNAGSPATDLGRFSTGDVNVGAIGVQP